MVGHLCLYCEQLHKYGRTKSLHLREIFSSNVRRQWFHMHCKNWKMKKKKNVFVLTISVQNYRHCFDRCAQAMHTISIFTLLFYLFFLDLIHFFFFRNSNLLHSFSSHLILMDKKKTNNTGIVLRIEWSNKFNEWISNSITIGKWFCDVDRMQCHPYEISSLIVKNQLFNNSILCPLSFQSQYFLRHSAHNCICC